MNEKERIEHYQRRLKWLKDDAYTWTTHCREVQEFAIPTHGRFLSNTVESYNDGKKKHSSVYNGAATYALWVLAAGIHNNLTSPTKPWYRLTLKEKEWTESEGVPEWLEAWTRIGLAELSSSNFYRETATAYCEIAGFGTTAMLIESLAQEALRYTTFTFGEYWLGLNEAGEADSLYRKVKMSTLDLVRRFGRDRVSDGVKSAILRGSLDDRWDVIHAIEPRDVEEIEDGSEDTPRGMPWKSVYFEESNRNNILGESGYKSRPFAAARWRTNPGDTYGRSPVMECLGDIKSLQYMEKIAAQGFSRQANPPLNAPYGSKRLGTISTRSDAVNYYDGINADAIKPTLAVNIDLNGVNIYKREIEDRIRRFLFNELFMAITDMDRQMTATEVRARQIERLTVLGPVVQQLQQTFLTPGLERTYQILWDKGKLPPPPQVLQGREWTLDYTGLLAQAQKATDTMSIDSLVAYLASLANVQAATGNLEVLDKVDMDQAVDEIGEMIGTPAKIIRSDEEVAKIRQARERQKIAQAQLASSQMMAEAAAPAARAAKDASETKVGSDKRSALDMFLGYNQ